LKLFLFKEEERIVNEIAARLRASSSAHYHIMEMIDLRPRMRALFEAYRESAIYGDSRFIADFVCSIGRKRLQQEYSLEELQLVLNALASAVWEAAAAAFKSRGAEAFEDLHRLSEAALWSKDCLAGVYAEEMKKERIAFGKLNKAFSEYLEMRHTDHESRPNDEKEESH